MTKENGTEFTIVEVSLAGSRPQMEWLEEGTLNGRPKLFKHNDTGSHDPHPDMKKALDKLRRHIVLIGNWHSNTQNDKITDVKAGVISKFDCTGFKLSGSGDNTKIILKGKVKLGPGTMGFAIPGIVLYNPSVYVHSLKLQKEVDAILDEFSAYFFEDKVAQSDQTEAFADADGDGKQEAGKEEAVKA